MISPRITTQTVTTKVYSIPSPANWKDVQDVLIQIKRDPALRNGDYDDAVTVVAYDDEIRFEFPLAQAPS